MSSRLFTLPAIQMLRACAALMVLLFHLGNVEQRYGQGYALLAPWSAAGQYGVDIFFAISGFIIVFSTHHLWHKGAREMAAFLRRRALRIYPVYWQFSLVVLAVFLIKPEWVNSSFAAQPSIWRSFLLLPQPTPPLVAVGWPLVHELYFYLALCLLFLLRVPFVCFLAVWAAATLALYMLYQGSDPAMLILASPYTFEFIFGCVAGWLYLRKTTDNAAGFWVSVGLFIASLAFLLQTDPENNVMQRALTCGLSAALILYFMPAMQNTQPLLARVLITIGNASFSLYLSHVLVTSAFGHVWRMADISGLAAHIIWLATAVLGALLVGIANYRFVEQPLQLYLKRRYP